MSSQQWSYCLQEHILRDSGHGEIWRASSRREGDKLTQTLHLSRSGVTVRMSYRRCIHDWIVNRELLFLSLIKYYKIF
jgi:hypothetical protein